VGWFFPYWARPRLATGQPEENVEAGGIKVNSEWSSIRKSPTTPFQCKASKRPALGDASVQWRVALAPNQNHRLPSALAFLVFTNLLISPDPDGTNIPLLPLLSPSPLASPAIAHVLT
jgi:hypothetical protein